MFQEKSYLKELECCRLCEWQCGASRLAGERGVCRVADPQVASCQLHLAPPQSYTIFLSGCNFRCLGCQNYQIARYPDQESPTQGFIEPKAIARQSMTMIKSRRGRLIGADRVFFSGGEPTIHLPYIEEIIKETRKIAPDAKVNFDTNGFLTRSSLERVLRFADSITYDIKAYSDDVHRAITGAPVEPVLRNAETIAKRAKDKLWEYRVLTIPEIVDKEEIKAICEFIADIDPSLPVCFLAFRPNFALDKHYGAPFKLMREAVNIAKKTGLESANWSGATGIEGGDADKVMWNKEKLGDKYGSEWARKAASFAYSLGCRTHPRSCGKCENTHKCPVKSHQPSRRT